MEDQLVNDLILLVVTPIVVLLIGLFINKPIRKWWKGRKTINEESKERQVFRVVHLSDPDANVSNFSARFIEQNNLQNLFQFKIEEFLRAPPLLELSELKKTNSKRDFIDRVGSILAYMRGEVWKGLTDNPPDAKFKGLRDLVITNIPIPDNYYGWNSEDRTILVISVAPILHLFPKGGKPTIDDFIVRMTQRMVTFSVIPEINPKQTHIETAVGCLFDFTVHLDGVVNVVRTPQICPSCYSLISRCRGQEFTLKLRKWLKATSPK